MDNTGTISKADKKGNEKRPDYKGSANIGGIDYWIAGWKREHEGSQFLSLKFEVKEKKEYNKKQEPDDIPF